MSSTSKKAQLHIWYYPEFQIVDEVLDNLDEIEEEFRVLSLHWIHPNIPQFDGLFFKQGATR